MAYEMELMQVNDMKRQLSVLARTIVAALDDKTVSPMEGLMLGQRGLMLALTLVSMLQGLPPEQQRHVLYVLEHGEFTLPPTARPLSEGP